jgi:hypothetical protein
MTFVELVREVPDNSPGILKRIFRPAPRQTHGLRYSPEDIERFFRMSLD